MDKKNELARIKALLRQATAQFERACRDLAEYMETSNKDLLSVADALGISVNQVILYLSVGQGQALPELVQNLCPGYRKLLAMDIADQRELMHATVPLVSRNGKRYTVLHVKVKDMRGHEADQVFSHGEMRSVAEQKEYLHNMLLRWESTLEGVAYHKVGETVVIDAKQALSRAQLQALLRRLGKKT